MGYNTPGIQDFAAFRGPHCIVLFEETCAEWTVACIGAMGQSITVSGAALLGSHSNSIVIVTESQL